MYERTVKGRQEYVFENQKEFRSKLPSEKLKRNWRTAPVGSYTLTDDKQVVRILKKDDVGVRTLLGMRRTSKYYTLDGKPVKNIYSFAGAVDHRSAVRNRKNPTSREIIFARYVADGNGAVDSYLKAFRTNNRGYAKENSRALLKQERIISMISKESSESMDKFGMDSDYLFQKTKKIIENLEGKDSDKLKAIEMCMKLRDMFPKDTKREALTIFQGFSSEQLQKLRNADEIEPIAHAERAIEGKVE